MQAGVSRQAYYKSIKGAESQYSKNEESLGLGLSIRFKQPYISCRKIYSLIKPDLDSRGIKVGRDKFIELMTNNGYSAKKKRMYVTTTQSKHNKHVYSNLIKHMEIRCADHVWVSDITYLRTSEGMLYLSLVTDLYSRKIMGYSLGKDLTTSNSIVALQMAIKASRAGKGAQYHHSDRGIQYCSNEYTSNLRKHGIASSMTRGGNPYENAVAERINGILKQEYCISDIKNSPVQCEKLVAQAIQMYNQERPHLSLKMKTPEQYYSDYFRATVNNNDRL